MRFTRQTFAKGKTGRKVGMNKTETEYNSELDIQKRAGLIEWFMFEGVKLRLADNTFYTPDFFVMLPDGTFQAHEVKGTARKVNETTGERQEYPLCEDAGKVKIKIAAELYPMHFYFCFRSKMNGWVKQEVGS